MQEHTTATLVASMEHCICQTEQRITQIGILVATSREKGWPCDAAEDLLQQLQELLETFNHVRRALLKRQEVTSRSDRVPAEGVRHGTGAVARDR